MVWFGENTRGKTDVFGYVCRKDGGFTLEKDADDGTARKEETRKV